MNSSGQDYFKTFFMVLLRTLGEDFPTNFKQYLEVLVMDFLHFFSKTIGVNFFRIFVGPFKSFRAWTFTDFFNILLISLGAVF